MLSLYCYYIIYIWANGKSVCTRWLAGGGLVGEGRTKWAPKLKTVLDFPIL